MLIARPNALILYATLAKGPTLPLEYQVNSTRQFMRALNRLGVTSAIDAGGGFQNYPEDYQVIQQLADNDQLTVRIAYNLFTQKPKEELNDFKHWTSSVTVHQGTDFLRNNGAGEMLVLSAVDLEDFLKLRPELAQSMEDELDPVMRHSLSTDLMMVATVVVVVATHDLALGVPVGSCWPRCSLPTRWGIS